MSPVDEALLGRWVHSFEEDRGGTSVYRPADFAFPRARGRRGLELRDGGVCIVTAIGRGDAPERREGTWQEAERGTLVCDVRGRRLRVTLIEPGHLEVADVDAGAGG